MEIITKKEAIKFMKEKRLVYRGSIQLAELCFKKFLSTRKYGSCFAAWKDFLLYVKHSKNTMRSERHLVGKLMTIYQATVFHNKNKPSKLESMTQEEREKLLGGLL